MLAGPAILIAVLAADGGTAWDAIYLHTEARSSQVQQRCVELVTGASEHEATDSALALKRARAAIDLAAPVRDELEALLFVPRGVEHPMGVARTGRLHALSTLLLECVQSADFLIVRVQRANQKKSPGADSARKQAEATFREYLARYPRHPTAETVRAWLREEGPPR